MANEKKVFSIQINGIKESTDAIAFLNDQLKDLEKNIKDLEKKQIKIKSGTSTSGSGSKSNKSQLTEEQKIQQQINKEIEKRAAMQTKEYQELLKQKKETKELADLQKLISKGDVVNEDGLIKFNQTIGGIKAELRSLNLYIDTLKNPGEDWDGSFEGLEEELAAATERAGKLQERLKALEALKGVYGRNVGNYPGKDDTFPGGSEVVKYDTSKLKEYISTLKEKIKTEGSDLNLLKSLQTAMDALLKRTKTNTSEFKDYQAELSQVNDELNKLSSKNIQGLRAEDIIDPKINIELKELKQNLQFDDVNQAIGVLEDKLYAMSKAGEQTSEAFKEIQETIIDLRRNVIDTDATIDAMVSRTRGLDLTVQSFQALTAAMQVGAGVAGLFGKNEEELQKTIARVTSLMSIAQGVQELYNQVTKKGTALNKLWQLSLAGAQKVINLFNKTQKAATAAITTNTSAIAANAAATTATATATTVATTATKVFTVAMKGLKIAIASTGIGLLVVALGELVSWFMKATDSSEKLAKSVSSFTNELNAIALAGDKATKWLDNISKIGAASEIDKLANSYANLKEQQDESIKSLQSWAKQINNTKTSLNNVEVLYSLSTLINRYKELQNEGYKIENINKAIVKSFLELNKEGNNVSAATVVDQLERINALGIDWDEVLNMQGVTANMNKIVELSQNTEDALFELMGNFTELSKKAVDDSNEAMKEGLAKRLKIIETSRERELKALDTSSRVNEDILNEEQLAIVAKARQAINAKYNRQELEARKEYAKEVANVEKTIQANRIAVMKEGLDKTLAQLELNRENEIDAARETGIKVGEQTKSINAKYDAEILKAKEAFYKQREEQYKQFAENYRQISNSFYEYEYQKSTQQVNVGLEASIGETSFDTDKSLNESVNEQRAFYEKLIQLKQDAALKLAEINLNKVTDDKYDSLQTENQRYQERLKLLEDYQKQGIITNEEYNTQLEHEQQQHADMVKQIEEQAWNKQLEIDRNYVNERKQIITEGNNGVIQSFNDYFNEIQRLEDKAITPNKNTGIINYKDTKANLTKVKQEYKSLMDNIKQQLNTLEQEFANGKISFDDFKTAKKELKSLEDSANQSMENVNQTLSTLVVTVADSISQFVGQYLGVLSGLWSTYNDIVMSSLDYQQEMLEEEYDMLEDAYQKQEELVQKHANKLNEIESELKDSRGDRRQHLIDQLAAEREAQIAALAEEQKIAKQKEQNQKRQDALEKKRREQEKKNSIVQATINTFTAMTNALAVQPWFVGLALSAVALAMGMAQVANIKKQKYADGGLLNGKSHKQGGIPVGNTGIEVEGNEYVVNKKSTVKNLPLIEYINSNRRTLTRDDLVTFFDNGKQSLVNKKVRAKYADGGQLPEIGEIDVKSLINYEPEPDNRPIVVSVVDIINATENVRNVQSVAGL